MTLGIIINPQAGGAAALAKRLHREFAPDATIVETARREELPAALATLRSGGVSVLVPFGGDGTVSRMLEAALPLWGDALPPLHVVPAGTMNMLASDLRLAGQPLRSLQRLRRALEADSGYEVITRRSLGTGCGAAGFTFGFGVPERFLKAYGGGGAGQALKLLASTAASIPLPGGAATRMFQPLRLSWQGDDQRVRSQALRIFLAMTIDALPLGFTVSPGAGQDHTAMQTLHGSPSAAFVLRNLWRLHRGAQLPGRQLLRERLTRAEFEFEHPTGWMMDGELHPPIRSLSLKLGPLVRFIRTAQHRN